MANYFITFAGGEKNFHEAGERIIKQADSLNFFDKTILYTDDFLKNDKEFWEKHSKFILNNKRGYGYYIWKPYIIKKTIENMIDGDKLLFLDCGCEIDVRKKELIKNFFSIINENNKLELGSTQCVEKEWNKMDLIIKLNMLKNEQLNTYQYQSGTILFFICKEIRDLVNEWYSIACNYNLIDDSESINKNLDCFIEHRHDQSIFSLLIKKYNLNNFSKYNLLFFDVIEVVRNRSGKSIL